MTASSVARNDTYVLTLSYVACTKPSDASNYDKMILTWVILSPGIPNQTKSGRRSWVLTLHVVPAAMGGGENEKNRGISVNWNPSERGAVQRSDAMEAQHRNEETMASPQSRIMTWKVNQ